MLRMSICSAVLIILTLIRQIHIIQLNSYNLDQQLIWYKKNFVLFLSNLILFITVFLTFRLNIVPSYVVLVISMLAILIENLPKKQKKKLVYTARIKRLIFVVILIFILFFLPVIINRSDKSIEYVLYSVALSPFIVFIGFLITLPIENFIRKKFINQAKNLLSSIPNIYVIGITGSFGKTSVKYYLSKILKTSFNVCITPESYNTAMGATLTIKNNLKSYDDIFVCEMGARRIGDIKEICDIVMPNGAILSDVGNMHLDTFKNIENVKKCKFELIDSVYKNKFDGNKLNDKFKNNYVLVNGDNNLINEKILEYDFDENSVWTYGLNETNDFYATNMSFTNKIIHFDIVFFANDANKKFVKSFETKLLGIFNIKNLVAAISYSLLLGIDISDIIDSVKKIEPVNHRLQLITNDPNNLIIDDAYNSNPKGARNAVDTLKMFDDYVRVIITPGMVELGDKQKEENMNFAEYSSDKVDYAIVVGNTNSKELLAGFRKNLIDDKVIFIEKVEEAIFYARNNISGKKVILLENDLSDNY